MLLVRAAQSEAGRPGIGCILMQGLLPYHRTGCKNAPRVCSAPSAAAISFQKGAAGAERLNAPLQVLPSLLTPGLHTTPLPPTHRLCFKARVLLLAPSAKPIQYGGTGCRQVQVQAASSP